MERGEPARLDYRQGALLESDVDADPLRQLRVWLDEAVAAGIPEPTAMTLATVDAGGVPDARVVLMQGFDGYGICWFTNRHSAKGVQLAAQPVAAAIFFWQLLERQVRLRGSVELLSDAASDAYFAARPRGSQLGAWASAQSEPIADRAALEASVVAAEERFAGREVPRPSHWGGYRLSPDSVELWQGRPARLHDRLVYLRTADGWELGRRQP